MNCLVAVGDSFAGEDRAKVVPVLLPDWQVEPEVVLDALDRRLGRNTTDVVVRRRGVRQRRDQLEDQERHEGDGDDDEDRPDEAPDYVVKHRPWFGVGRPGLTGPADAFLPF